MRVLIADDSSTMRMILRRALKGLRITDVVEAADGKEAIQLFRTGGFDLVLTDWNLPHKSGLEVLLEIRELNPEIPIIMVTTEAERFRVMDAIQAGVTDYIIKPFNNDTLEKKLWPFLEHA